MEYENLIAAYSNGLNRARLYTDRIELGVLMMTAYPISEIARPKVGWGLGGRMFSLIMRDGREINGPLLHRADAEACQNELSKLLESYSKRFELDAGPAIGCTVLGGSGTNLMSEKHCTVVFSASKVRFVQGSEYFSIEVGGIKALDIGGPGLVEEGGGFIGGGIGLEGAAQGIAIATILNALTSSSSTNTVIHVAWNGAEVFLHTALETPDSLRMRLSAVFVAMSAGEPAGGNDIASQIERLRDLRNSGALSEEEFAAAKAKILG